MKATNLLKPLEEPKAPKVQPLPRVRFVRSYVRSKPIDNGTVWPPDIQPVGLALELRSVRESIAARSEAMQRGRAKWMQREQRRFDAMHKASMRGSLFYSLQSVCNNLGVSFNELFERRLNRSLNRNQQMMANRKAVFKALRNLGFSYPEIGAICGVNHTTVLANISESC